jgi:hypothetical protein
MALQHLDNFAHYGGVIANGLALYSSFDVSGFQTDRWGVANGAARIANADDITANLTGNPATVITGFAYKGSTTGQLTALVYFRDGATAHVGLGIDAANRLFVFRGTTATVLGTAANPLLAGSWDYVEFKALVADAGGTAEVRVNGTAVITLSGQDTRNGGTAQVTNVLFAPGGTNIADICDWYIADTTGTANNDFIGDLRVREQYPNGAGTYTDFTPSAGSNYQAVDETAQDGDTTYVESSTVGHKDTYAYANLSGSPTIKGARLLLLAKKDDAGARSIAPTVKSGATEDDGATAALSTSYVYYSKIWETDPNSAAAWTAANLNAAEFGVEVKA